MTVTIVYVVAKDTVVVVVLAAVADVIVVVVATALFVVENLWEVFLSTLFISLSYFFSFFLSLFPSFFLSSSLLFLSFLLLVSDRPPRIFSRRS